MKVDNQGTVVLFTPENEAEHRFFNEEVVTEEWQWSGGSCVIDRRFADDLAAGCTAAGFVVWS